MPIMPTRKRWSLQEFHHLRGRFGAASHRPEKAGGGGGVGATLLEARPDPEGAARGENERGVERAGHRICSTQGVGFGSLAKCRTRLAQETVTGRLKKNVYTTVPRGTDYRFVGTTG